MDGCGPETGPGGFPVTSPPKAAAPGASRFEGAGPLPSHSLLVADDADLLHCIGSKLGSYWQASEWDPRGRQ